MNPFEHLVYRYSELVDAGDFAGAGDLFRHGSYVGSSGVFSGAQAVTDMLTRVVITYDGTPRTKHVVTNVIVDGDSARSYVTVYQGLPDVPLRPIVAGRYFDRFAEVDGEWGFLERRIRVDLVGDTSRHLR
ncbi:nuclear transport factor 2 family protein [Kibdelosporangium lantanae]|uniref:Nuclear transport factor 2 family protein n=1 Tax=Kibdelosporangium lantanae TaxID=1497396 RepID=A0ABW3MF03_9PSEU